VRTISILERTSAHSYHRIKDINTHEADAATHSAVQLTTLGKVVEQLQQAEASVIIIIIIIIIMFVLLQLHNQRVINDMHQPYPGLKASRQTVQSEVNVHSEIAKKLKRYNQHI
jgi:hypothetical protein